MPAPQWANSSGDPIVCDRHPDEKKGSMDVRNSSNTLASLAPLALFAVIASASADDSLVDALTGGTADLFLRYRFEFVDDGAPAIKNAYASTLRTALGYHSGTFHAFSAYVQFEDVHVIGQDLYNNGGENGVTDRATVVDPQGTEINQAFLRFGGLAKTVLSLGRQDIAHREAPLHRYIGNVLFRQNWQSYDAFRLINLSLPQTTVDYAYVWNVNRIFGEDNPLPDASDFPMRSHFLNVQYGGFSLAKIEAYGYLLDFNSARAERFSTATLGLRMQGDYRLTPSTKLLFAAELANQRDYGGNPNAINVNYFAGEVGINYSLGGPIESASAKLSYEILAGKGGLQAFQTPVGTNHAFQGAADRFLVTPGDGVRDVFATLGMKALGAQWSVAYHRFTSDRDHYRYGDEWDFSVECPIAKQFLVGLQYAAYRANRNGLNVARNSVSEQTFDLTKAWAYIQFKY